MVLIDDDDDDVAAEPTPRPKKKKSSSRAQPGASDELDDSPMRAVEEATRAIRVNASSALLANPLGFFGVLSRISSIVVSRRDSVSSAVAVVARDMPI